MKDYIIGIDLGGTNIKGSIFDKHFNRVIERRLPTEAEKGSGHVMDRIVLLINTALSEAGLSQKDIDCMGMGIPGLLNPELGISMFSPNFPDWEDVPVVQEMQKHFSFPVYIDHDVRVNLYGEWLHGAGKGKRNIVLITLGTGLGSAIIMDGHVLYGATSSAGEFGHMNMYREGRPCRCGSSGCLGRYVSALGMVRTFVEKLQQGSKSIITEWVENDTSKITAEMISRAYDVGDQTAIETLEETGELLGFGLSNAINLFNPELIIIGGGMSQAGERLLKSTRAVINEHALKISRSNCEMVVAKLGDAAGMIGAATYAMERKNHS